MITFLRLKIKVKKNDFVNILFFIFVSHSVFKNIFLTN